MPPHFSTETRKSGGKAARTPQDLDVGVILAGCPPLSGTALFFPVLEKLWITENSHAAALIYKGKGCAAVQPLFVFMGGRQDDGH